MTNIVLGNSASYGTVTSNAANLASAIGSNNASASSGALTLKNRIKIDNSDANDPKAVYADGETKDMGGSQTISSNTEGPIIGNGLFPTNITVNSNVFLYSDDPTQAAIIFKSGGGSVTNSGFIVGRGGNGGDGDQSGSGSGENGQNGGDAIAVISGSVTVTNNSGGFIAGGGGGGGGHNGVQSYGNLGAGGGGGAGGGDGGRGGQNAYTTAAQAAGTSGGGPNQKGDIVRDYWGANGGGAGVAVALMGAAIVVAALAVVEYSLVRLKYMV